MSSIWTKGCMLMIVCVFYLTLHDYPSLVEGESHGILCYFHHMNVFTKLATTFSLDAINSLLLEVVPMWVLLLLQPLDV